MIFWQQVRMMSDRVDILTEVTRVLRMEGQSILDCADRIAKNASSAEALREAVGQLHAALERGGKIVVTGVGKSGKVAQKIAATMCSTGSLAVFLHPTEGLHGDLGLITPKDAILALSYTGNTDELVRIIPALKSLRVPIIGIGGNPESQLARKCDLFLDAGVSQEACPHNLAPTSSTTLALALGDALAIALMQLRGFDAQRFAQNHPGGALGRRLHLRVEDVMHTGSEVPTLPGSAKMDEVVIQSTRGRLGAVLITDGPKLLGIITDGDIRRALQHHEGFFSLQASAVMTRSPVTVHRAVMAQDALDLMENRPNQISVLPVVDEHGNWEGLLRLHDLVRSL
jgi:arabinose-5-phosphate isomerase